ncbi:MAG: SDR family oxidoreductase [Candidatus Helarchaeota archaeon]|nr:SDR family oxidoreductase [Candidatus Helarchaeota archaeon]
MDSFKGKSALITGASSGIGYEFVKLFAKDGANLIITARSEERLLNIKREIENKHKVSVLVLAKDLSRSEAPEEICNQLGDKGIPVDILVNNAGVGYLGNFSDTDLEKHLKIIQLNILSLVHLTGLLLPSMIENGYGKILNVSSMGGFCGIPLHSVYSATKAFVLTFTESIAIELEGTGVTVTCLCPGPTKTNFFKSAEIENVRYVRYGLMGADKVAKVGFDALKNDKTIAVPGLRNKFFIFMERFIPRKTITKMAKKLHESNSPDI